MAVLIGGSPQEPVLIEKVRLELSDAAVPDSAQPFHAALELPEREAAKVIARLAKVVRESTDVSISELVERHRVAGLTLKAAGLVVGSVVDPATIKNDHIRAHAEEGRLFRVAIQEAAGDCGLKTSITAEKDLYRVAAKALEMPESDLKKRVTELGRGSPGSWKAEAKTAALAAWMLLQ
jgi:hypothetical protein